MTAGATRPDNELKETINNKPQTIPFSLSTLLERSHSKCRRAICGQRASPRVLYWIKKLRKSRDLTDASATPSRSTTLTISPRSRPRARPLRTTLLSRPTALKSETAWSGVAEENRAKWAYWWMFRYCVATMTWNIRWLDGRWIYCVMWCRENYNLIEFLVGSILVVS